MTNKVKLFEQQKVRTHWDEEKQKWFFSIIDVIEILTGSPRPRKYWNALKTKLKQDEFAFLTNVIHQEWTGLSVKKHKNLKGLKTQNLRDHMSEAELIFTALAELSTRQIAESEEAKGVQQNAVAGKKGGKIAKD